MTLNLCDACLRRGVKISLTEPQGLNTMNPYRQSYVNVSLCQECWDKTRRLFMTLRPEPLTELEEKWVMAQGDDFVLRYEVLEGPGATGPRASVQGVK